MLQLDPSEKQLCCDDLGCVYRHGNHVVAFPELEVALLEDCVQAEVVVTPAWVQHCDPAHLLQDPDF